MSLVGVGALAGGSLGKHLSGLGSAIDDMYAAPSDTTPEQRRWRLIKALLMTATGAAAGAVAGYGLQKHLGLRGPGDGLQANWPDELGKKPNYEPKNFVLPVGGDTVPTSEFPFRLNQVKPKIQ